MPYMCLWQGSACCNDTASEHAMMDRLIRDDLVHWAENYNVDGFRYCPPSCQCFQCISGGWTILILFC